MCNDVKMVSTDTIPAQWLTRLEVMDYLKVGSPNTLKKLIDQDGLPVHMLRNEQRFDRVEVDSWLRSRCIDYTPGGVE